MRDFLAGILTAGLVFWWSHGTGEAFVDIEQAGRVKVFKKPSLEKGEFIFLVSGSEGWSKNLDQVAYDLAGEKNVVVGIVPSQLKNFSPTDQGVPDHRKGINLSTLSKIIQKKLKTNSYSRPIVIGFGDSAPLLYRIAGDPQDDVFSNIIYLDSCEKIKPELLKRDNRVKFKRTIGVYYDSQSACKVKLSREQRDYFEFKKIENLESHRYQVQRWPSEIKTLWTGSLRAPTSISGELSDSISLIQGPKIANPNRFAIIYSGDGGWADFTQELSDIYLKKGIPVVGINSLNYFWQGKTPKEGAKDLQKLIENYQKIWKTNEFELVGFSFGADTIPFFIQKLPETIRKNLKKITLISSGRNAKFEFEILDWITGNDEGEPIKPVLTSIKNIPILCLYGKEDIPSVCGDIQTQEAPDIKSIALNGGHHLDYNFVSIENVLFGEKRTSTRR